MKSDFPSISMQIGAHELRIETGEMAWQASGAVTVFYDDTVLLVTATSSEPRAGLDFFPLTVEYRERRAAGGGFMGGFRKREGRPSDIEILGARLVDRSIRPLFPSGFRDDTQVIATVLSAQPEYDPAVFAIAGASAALALSDIPWSGPVAGMRVARVDGRFVAFPTEAQRARASLDLIVSAGPQGLLMVEGQVRELPEAVVVEALSFAAQRLAPLVDAIAEFAQRAGTSKRSVAAPPPPPPQVTETVAAHEAQLRNALCVPAKQARRRAVAAVREQALAPWRGDDALRAAAAEALSELEHRVARGMILEGKRFDGRAHDEVRPLAIRTGLLPRTHGSALFSRGETQALATAVLGTAADREVWETLFEEVAARFYLHYNFPPFSTGETKPLRGPSRREIGHGTLARRAIEPVLPAEDDFPYTMRVISDVLSSNGSSSMATVCAGILALLDAGVPLLAPVAGVAMGLVQEGDRVAILTDILGDEDHLGDMDFKVTGTRAGVTALQMDIKIEGLDEELLTRALEQARRARLYILDAMAEVQPGPRRELRAGVPRMRVLRIEPERIGELIGPGGRTIRDIQAATGARVDVDDTGRVVISAPTGRAADAALKRVRDLFREAQVDEVLDATVRNVTDSVAFLELFPGTEGVLHVSEYANERTPSLRNVLHPGDVIQVRVLGVDRRGRIALSRKAV